MSKTMLLKPRISEKAYELSQSSRVYVFDVPTIANKLTVGQAVSDQFEVTVTKVNISNRPGKAKRAYRKRGRQTIGRQADSKRAYVTLKEGDSIALFPKEEDDKKAKKAVREKK